MAPALTGARAVAVVLLVVLAPIAASASISDGGTIGSATVATPNETVTPTPTPADEPPTPTPTDETPTDGTPTDGTPTDGTPTDGTPTDGTPTYETFTPTPTDGTPIDSGPSGGGSGVNVTGSVIRADGSRGGDTVGTKRAPLNSSGGATTNASGGYTLRLPSNSTFTHLYAQGDLNNGTGRMPRDGSPDIFTLGQIQTGTSDIDFGQTTLPQGYVVDVYVNDTEGNPVQGATVGFTHRNGGTNATWTNRTSADGHVYPFQTAPNLEDPGLELAGSVQIIVFSPNGSLAQPAVRNLTVNGSENVTVTLPAPASGDLTVEEPVYAGYDAAQFQVRNETSVPENVTYYWSFADGSDAGSLTGTNETAHRYRRPGEYRASVSVSENGTDRLLYSDSVNVTVQPAGTADLVVNRSDIDASQNVTFRVTNVSLAVDDNVSFYSWRFGDDSGDFTSHPVNQTVHAYGANGSYTASVVAYNRTETRLFTATRNVTVGSGESNQPPSAYFAPNRTTANVGDPIGFGATDTLDSDGSVVELRWDLDGDGTTDATTSDPSEELVYAYGSAGTYNATLTAVDDDGATDSHVQTITIETANESNQPPSAYFAPNRTTAKVGDPIGFGATDTNDPDGSVVELRWDLDGDGTTDRTTADPSTELVYAYGSAGTFNATLTAVDDDGATDSHVQTITVEAGPTNQPPDALLSANRTTVVVGESVRLDASDSVDSNGSIVEYRWDFDGDGVTDTTTQAPTNSVSTSYATAGSYDATVTVVDDDGAVDNDTETISVQSAVDPVGGAWPQFHYDTANSGYNASASGPAPPVETTWSTGQLTIPTHPPVVWNEQVVTVDGDYLRAYDAATGAPEWNTSLRPAGYSFDDGERFDLTSAPTIVDGVAYVGAFWNDSSANTTYEMVYAVDAATGAELWNVSRPAAWEGFFDDGIDVPEPKVADGRVVVTSAVSDSVFTLDAGGSHAELWRDSLQDRHGGELLAPPTVADGRVFVAAGEAGSSAGHVYAFDLSTGDHLWNDSIGYNYDDAALAYGNGTVYVARDGTGTLAYDAANGTKLWTGANGYVGEYGSAAVAGDYLVVNKGFTAQRSVGIPGGVRALDRDTGTLVWEYNASDAVTGAPAVAGDRVYLGTFNGTVEAVDLATGAPVWSHRLDNGSFDNAPVMVAPAVADGIVYARAGTNQLVRRGIFAIDTAETTGGYDADLAASPQPAYANVTNVTLSVVNANGTTPDHYRWTFGDGTTVETDHPDADAGHVYGAAGTYDARVDVYDAGDTLLTTAETTVTVSQPTGDLVAVPSTADANVTNVTLRLRNLTGPTPSFYSWDLDGDGQFEASTSHPNTDTNYTYAGPLGERTPRVVASDGDEQRLFTAETTVDVVDRVPPVARASAPDSVAIGADVVVNASNSTDNHAIANYTFAPDTGAPVTTTGPTTTLSFATGGTHSVNVTVTDESGNTNMTTVEVFVRELPDLTVEVTANETQRLTEGASATVTVTNNGTDTASGVAVRLNATAQVNYYRTAETSFDRTLGDIAPGESATATVELTDWAEGNVSGSRPRVDLVATVDPADAVAEGDETNNVAENATEIGYSDLVAYVYVPYNTLPDEPAEVRTRFYNRGSLPSPSHEATLAYGDGSANVTISVPSIDAGDDYETTRNHTFPAGRNRLVVNVTDDPSRAYNVDTDVTNTEAFSFRLEGPSATSEIERNGTFYVYATGQSNFAADQNASLSLPDGLELTDSYPVNQSEATDSYAYYSWEVRAVNESGDTPFEIGVSAASRNQTDAGNTSVSVIAPRVRVEDSGSVSVTGSGTRTTTLDVRNETTFEHSLSLTAQLGPQGRTLAGLDYLFDYPHGCVEQTASPMLTALNTDTYYRENPAPNGYDEQRTNDSIAVGVERLSTGETGQHDNGAWSMYGNDPSGDMYYTAYALFGTSSVASDPVQGARPGVSADLSEVDVNATVLWLESNQESDGRLANDKTYFDDDDAMTGFTLVALDRAGQFNATATAAADRLRSNATSYLVASQRDDGSWGDGESNAMSTALAVWGLSVSGEDTPAVNAAIDDGVAWLVANQETGGDAAGAWTEPRSGSWRSTGTTSETTGYAVLALNETGLAATNDTISDGTAYLVTTYDAEGSWGHTRASAVAIEALLELGVDGPAPDQSVTVRFGTAATPDLVNRTLSVDDGTPRRTLSLSDSELQTLRDAGPPIRVTVEANGTGQLVVGFENDQLVNADEYDANTGGA